MMVHIISPLNLLVLSLKNSYVSWRMTMAYWILNQVGTPIVAPLSDEVSLQTQDNTDLHMGCSHKADEWSPTGKEGEQQFAFAWNRQKDAYAVLPQGCVNLPQPSIIISPKGHGLSGHSAEHYTGPLYQRPNINWIRWAKSSKYVPHFGKPRFLQG